jgi:hypothetical protein
MFQKRLGLERPLMNIGPAKKPSRDMPTLLNTLPTLTSCLPLRNVIVHYGTSCNQEKQDIAVEDYLIMRERGKEQELQ